MVLGRLDDRPLGLAKRELGHVGDVRQRAAEGGNKKAVGLLAKRK